MIKVSVIIPVYNADKYLTEFMDSLMSQTLDNIQIICIDDCSSDSSYKILLNYKENTNVKILHNKNNMGAAKTRNIGLQLAEGDYVIFLDCDDILQKDYLQKLYEACCEWQADIAIGRIELFEKNIFITKKFGNRYSRLSMIESYPVIELPCEFESIFQIILNNPVDKLISRKLIFDNDIYFQDLPCTNDLSYAYKAVLSSKKIVYVEDAKYYYRFNISESISGRWKNKQNFLCEAMDEVLNYKQKHKISDKLYRSFFWKILQSEYCYYFSFSKDVRDEHVKVFHRYYKKWKMDQYYKDNSCSKLERTILNNLLDNKYDKPYIDILFDNCGEVIVELIKQNHNKGKKIALWGAGCNGKKLVQYLKTQPDTIDFIIDNDIKKQGECFENLEICAYEKVKDKIDLIFVMSHSVHEEVDKQIKFEISTLNLIGYMEMKVLNSEYCKK